MTTTTDTDTTLHLIRERARDNDVPWVAALVTLALEGSYALDADDRAALIAADVDPDDTHPETARKTLRFERSANVEPAPNYKAAWYVTFRVGGAYIEHRLYFNEAEANRAACRWVGGAA